MKRIFLISVLLILIFTYLSGEDPNEVERDVIAYWSFDIGRKSNSFEMSELIPSDIGEGEIKWMGEDRVSGPGTGLNVLEGFVIEGIYNKCIGYNISSAVSSKEFSIYCPIEYYENIELSYAVKRFIGGFNKHIVSFLDASDIYQEKCIYDLLDTEYNLKIIDFSNNSDVNDFSDFTVKIILTGNYNVDSDCFTRFDNILITGTPIHHFIPNRPNTIANTTITFDKGMADNITDSEAIPSLPNPNIAADEMESLALDLKGEGPWYLTLQNDKEYCAYYRGDTWVEVDKSDEGFKIEIEAPTNRSANKLFIVFSTQQPTLPIELSSFSVSTTPGSAPKITWETASETALNGYYVLRSENPHLTSAEIISPLIFAQNSSFYTTYEHEDETAITGKKYYYWLHVLELNQADSYAGPIVLHCPEEETQQPEPIYPLTKIRDIYPNPFNPSTNVCFELAQDNEVSFKIYNLRGKEVLRLDSRQYSKGLHHISIDSKTHDGRELPAGVYLLKMDAGGNSYLRKMTLLK